jgi:hypothetical protein
MNEPRTRFFARFWLVALSFRFCRIAFGLAEIKKIHEVRAFAIKESSVCVGDPLGITKKNPRTDLQIPRSAWNRPRVIAP